MFLLAALTAAAQLTTGSISGSVQDPNGASVPSAKVVAKNESTGLIAETVSTEAGLYLFASLPAGMYSINVEKTGFKKLVRGGIEIRVAQRVGLDLKLEIGDVQQTVDVTAEAPLLEPATSERGSAVSPKMMDTLPLFTGGIRNPEAFINYQPGVNLGAETSISGSGGRGKEVLIDGGSLTIPESGGVVFNFPASEMFGEFKLLTASYSAEHGRFGGGVELFITKSGNNDIHGRGFWNLRRDIFNANSWANNRAGRARAKERFNEAGFALGGPVVLPKYDGRNKTFWFFTLSRDLRPATAGQALYTVPTQAMKRGDFTGFSIFDPATTTGTTRLPFAGNLIPQSRISRVSSAILPSITDPTRGVAQNNFDFVNVSQLTDTIWSLKFDHNFTPNNRIAYFHSLQDQNTQATTGFDGPLGIGLGDSFQRPQYIRVNHDLVINPTVLLHSTVSFSRTRQGWGNPAQQGFASKVGLSVPTDATPRFRFSARDAISPWGVQDGKVSGGGNNNGQNNTTYHINSHLSWLRGRHEIKLGGDLRRLRTFAFDAAGTNGLFNFENFQTADLAALGTTGHSFASFLLGSPDRFEVNNLPVPEVQIRYGYHAGYFQDNFKATNKLTVQLGFRYEVPIGWHMSNYNMSTFSPTATNPAAGNRAGAMIFMGPGPGRTGTKRPYDTDFTNVGPRLGFAYMLGSKTVLRGGYGIYYQTLGNGGCGCTLGFGGRPGVTQSDGRNPAFQWDGGVPRPTGGLPPFIDPALGNFLDVDYVGPDFGMAPRVYNWSLNIQHEVKNLLVDIAYVGNRGRGLNSTLDANQVAPQALSNGALMLQPITAATVQQAGFRAPFDGFGNRTLAQALRPYPQFLNIQDRNSGDGRTWYDSLQAKLERRFGSLQTQASYTWSKSLSSLHFRQIFSQNFNVGAQDNYNLGAEKSYLPFDQPHVFNWLMTYELPFGKGKRFLGSSNKAVDMVVGGWNVATAFRYSTPAPIRMSSTNTLANVLFTRDRRVNQVNQAITSGISRDALEPDNANARWFNPGVFANPGQFEFGTAAWYHSSFRQPRQLSENFSIAKNLTVIRVKEQDVKFRYRADFFNVFNRVEFNVDQNFQSANFGRATGPNVGARIITMGLLLEF
ncbi:MAG: carboxypeptidase regulatory-like domain-containing protein [Bryobacterales bacterium]|nr:carboxypeptidase regulatory-like domain-containing protein [Bryobacterales bacterium]